MSEMPNQQDPLRMKAEAQLARAPASADHTSNSAVRATQFASLAAIVAIVVGAMVLVGWAADIVVLKSILPGWFPLKANAAVCHILTGIALWLTVRPPVNFNPQLAILLARFFALLAGLIGLLTLGEYMFGWNPGFDQWLFREPVGAVGTSHPGRMAQEAALNFALLSVALWITGGSHQTHGIMRARWTVLASVSLGLLVTILGLVALLSYLTPGLGAYGWFGLSIMAMHAAILFTILGMAVIAANWQPDVLPWLLGRRTTATFACGMAVLVFIGFNTSRSQSWMKETNRQIADSEAVLSDIESTLIEVIRAQAHTRGYVITGDEQYSTHYLEAKANSNVKLDALRKLVAGNPHQQQQFARIEVSVNAELQWFQQVIDARRTGMTDAVRNQMVAHGEELLGNLRNTFDQIEGEHQQRIQQLKQEAERVSLFFYLTIFTGTFASLLIFLSVIFRLNSAVIERNQEEEKVRQLNQDYDRLTDNADEAIFRVEAKGGHIIYCNPAAERIFGYSLEEWQADPELGFKLIHPDYREKQQQIIEQIRKNKLPVKNVEFGWIAKGGKTVLMEYTITPLIDAEGEVVIFESIGRDISERKRTEQKLQNSLAAQEVLMREIHHRVKNNLQMMSSLLELQSGYVKDEQVQGFFKDCQQRIQSMAMIHEQLYHNKNLAKIDFAAYLHSLMDNLRGQYGERCSRVNIQINASACTLPVDIAIPCGLVVSELVSNVFKHAFPEGRAGELRIGLQCNGDGKVILEIADDGVGLPAGLDVHHSKSFGMQLVTLMVEEQLHGKLSIESNGHGRFHDETGVTSRSRQSSSSRDLEVAPTGTRVVCETGGSK